MPKMNNSFKITIVCVLFCLSYIIYVSLKGNDGTSFGTVNAQKNNDDKKAEETTTSETKKSDDSSTTKVLTFTRDIDPAFVEEIKQKEIELQNRQAELERRKENLDILEADINKRLKELNNVKQQLEEVVVQVDAKHQKEIKQLVSVLESMKPAQSAQILEGLPIDDAVNIILQMQQKKAAKILDIVKPETAIKITELINNQKMNKPLKE